MEELIETLEDIVALGESLAILIVAPKHGAGEMLPEHLQRMTGMIVANCKAVQQKIINLSRSLSA